MEAGNHGDGAATWAWQRQGVWSSAANRLRSQTQRSRRVLLVLTVLGATCALAASQLQAAHQPLAVALGVIGAVAMAGVGLLAGSQDVQKVKKWTVARAVSEAIKTEVFLHLTSVDPYSGEDKDARLDAAVQRLEKESFPIVLPSTAATLAQRPLPSVHDVESYLDVRVRQSQLEGFYVPRAADALRRLRGFKTVGVALALTASVLAALTTVAPSAGAWAAVVTTVAGTVAAYAASQHYETLWVEYTKTAEELQRLDRRRTDSDGSPLADKDLIKSCEDVISAQNRAWVATWGKGTGQTQNGE